MREEIIESEPTIRIEYDPDDEVRPVTIERRWPPNCIVIGPDGTQQVFPAGLHGLSEPIVHSQWISVEELLRLGRAVNEAIVRIMGSAPSPGEVPAFSVMARAPWDKASV